MVRTRRTAITAQTVNGGWQVFVKALENVEITSDEAVGFRSGRGVTPLFFRPKDVCRRSIAYSVMIHDPLDNRII